MKIIRLLILMLLFSFFLNFAWEFLQSQFYGSFKDSLEINYPRYLIAIIGDSFYTILIYAMISMINKDLEWIMKSFGRKNIIFSILIGFVTAAFIEYKGIFILHKWNYSEIMPTFFGIGIIPLLQMMILPVLSFKMENIFMRNGTGKTHE